MGELCHTLQLIDGNGEFNVVGLEEFVKTVKLTECGLSYAVVGIMGLQSSGKSTLLNHLFYTNFKEMDADEGRWCHDIGREHTANKPLLKTVFQAMMSLFSPRKTTLLFVIRDKTKTPLERLERGLRKDVQKIWDTVSKPQALKDTPLSEFFYMEVIALSSYEDKEEQFKEQVAQLRKRFFHSISPGGLAGDRRGVVPASGFCFSAQKIWEVIRENKDLDLPAHKVMVATVRCEEIANEKLSGLASDKDLMALENAVQAGPVSGFGKQISSILETYLSEYNRETIHFDENIRDAKRLQLENKALNCVHPQYLTMLRHLRTATLENFRTQLEQSFNRGEGFATSVRSCTQSCMLEFDQGCADASIKQAKWDDYSKVREKLHRNIEAHSSSVWEKKLSAIAVNYEEKLAQALTEPVESLFSEKDTWPSIRELLRRETESAISGFSTAVAGFELDEETFNKMVQNLKDYAITVVERKAREEARKVMIRMKDRFSTIFYHDHDSKRRVWTGKEHIRGIAKDACSESLKLLSVMAAIRLDENPDKIENVLFSSLMDGTVSVLLSQDRKMGASPDPLDSSTWEEVPPNKTLITPVQCKSLWREFMEYSVPLVKNEEEKEKIWEVIRENKDLDLPAHKVMVATVRCEEIANEKLSGLASDKDLMALENAVQAGPVSGFGKRISSILETYLSEYDRETIHFDENIRDAKQLQLENKALNCVHPQYLTMLWHLRTTTLENFRTQLEQSLNRGEGFATSVRSCTQSCMLEFDQGCADASVKQAKWDDDSKVREKLHCKIEAHSSSVREKKLSAIAVNFEEELAQALTEPVESLFSGKDTWPSIRELLRRETESAISRFSTVVAGFELDEETFNKMVQNLKDYAITVVERKAREEARKVMIRMKDRFSTVFYHDHDSKRRVWTGEEHIRGIAKEARSESLKLLSVRAAIRLDENPNKIENVLFSNLMDGTVVSVPLSQDTEMGASLDPLASSTWEEVPPNKTLITPVQCKSLWREFIEYADPLVKDAEVEVKLRETTMKLERQLAEEQATRLKAEEIAQKAQMELNDAIRKQREDLERAQRERERLRNQGGNGGCAIL